MGNDSVLGEALRLCRNAVTAADMRMALSIALPGRLGASLAETAEV
jgi:hypothetical protein